MPRYQITNRSIKHTYDHRVTKPALAHPSHASYLRVAGHNIVSSDIGARQLRPLITMQLTMQLRCVCVCVYALFAANIVPSARTHRALSQSHENNCIDNQSLNPIIHSISSRAPAEHTHTHTGTRARLHALTCAPKHTEQNHTQQKHAPNYTRATHAGVGVGGGHGCPAPRGDLRPPSFDYPPPPPPCAVISEFTLRPVISPSSSILLFRSPPPPPLPSHPRRLSAYPNSLTHVRLILNAITLHHPLSIPPPPHPHPPTPPPPPPTHPTPSPPAQCSDI